MSPRLRAAVVELLEAIEEEDRARAEKPAEPRRVDELAQAKARRALERYGLRKMGSKR